MVVVTNANSHLNGEFRYVDLAEPVRLTAGATYALSMDTAVDDGDLFHHFAAYSAVSPSPSGLVGNFVARVSADPGAYPGQYPDGADGVANRHPDMFQPPDVRRPKCPHRRSLRRRVDSRVPRRTTAATNRSARWLIGRSPRLTGQGLAPVGVDVVA